MSTHEQASVLLVTMPWATPVHPSLGIGLLSGVLQEAGIACEALYGNLLLPKPIRPSVYTIESPGQYEDRTAGLSFVPHLYPSVAPEEIARTVADRHIEMVGREGHLDVTRLSLDRPESAEGYDKLIAQTLEDIEAAAVCLERCMESIEKGRHQVIGFSLTFETQLVSSLALARRIKERWPDRKIVLGGAACISGQGRAMLRSFPWVDAVCLGEGEPIVVDLVKALRGQGELAQVRGISYRQNGRINDTAPLSPMSDLDWLPLPDYAPYLEQKAASDWADSISVLLFETSRGCWWGEKHLCSFCGLNAESLTFRSKSPEVVLREIDSLAGISESTYGLQAVDNIFDMRYFKDLVPMLVEFQKKDPVGLFFEIKSNLKRGHLFQLVASGLLTLQPGIESFSDHILELMDKGADAFQQINFIKWAHEVGVRSTYNILLRNPGETVEDYLDMIEMVPFLNHLPAPNGIANMQLERYSPYFLKPEQYGIANVRPKAHYKLMFPDPDVDIESLVYQFDFDHQQLDDPELVDIRRRYIEAILGWQRSYTEGTLRYYMDGNRVHIIDRRGSEVLRETLAGPQAEIFRYLDPGRSFDSVRRRFKKAAGGGLRSLLEYFTERRWVYHDRRKDKYIVVCVRGYKTREEYLSEMQAALGTAPARFGRPEDLAAVPASLSG